MFVYICFGIDLIPLVDVRKAPTLSIAIALVGTLDPSSTDSPNQITAITAEQFVSEITHLVADCRTVGHFTDSYGFRLIASPQQLDGAVDPRSDCGEM